MKRIAAVFLAAGSALGVASLVPMSSAQAADPYAGELASLKVTADHTVPGYSRTGDFGKAWDDNNSSDSPYSHNGCDTRDDILHRDLTHVVMKAGSKCTVASGVRDPEPYTGKRVVWERGTKTSGLDIDHMVPLKRAWDMGASTWTPAQRLAYANDPVVLLTVDASANRAKGDKSPEAWMPPSKAEHCDYARRYITVSSKYKLAISPGDKTALTTALATCAPVVHTDPNMPVPSPSKPKPTTPVVHTDPNMPVPSPSKPKPTTPVVHTDPNMPVPSKPVVKTTPLAPGTKADLLSHMTCKALYAKYNVRGMADQLGYVVNIPQGQLGYTHLRDANFDKVACDNPNVAHTSPSTVAVVTTGVTTPVTALPATGN